MLRILYPSGINWFYEGIAHDLRDDLAAAGAEAELLNAEEFLASTVAREKNDHIILISLSEIAHTVTQNNDLTKQSRRTGALREKLLAYRRRILLNLDAIHTHWFKNHLDCSNGMLTDIFDLSISPQSAAASVAGINYTWIPESFTTSQRQNLPTIRSQPPIPWAFIGHNTPQRSQTLDTLVNRIAPNGLVFLPNLRPYSPEGSRNLSRSTLFQVLQKTQYYIWVSHHQYPYHEGFRAIHALINGAIPVKLDPLFAAHFVDVPWVYSSIAAFDQARHMHGPPALYQRAIEFISAGPTIGESVARALQSADIRQPGKSLSCAAL